MLLRGQFLNFVLMDELFKKIRFWFIFFNTVQREIYTKVIQMLGCTNIFCLMSWSQPYNPNQNSTFNTLKYNNIHYYICYKKVAQGYGYMSTLEEGKQKEGILYNANQNSTSEWRKIIEQTIENFLQRHRY